MANKQQKASDVFRETQFVFTEKGTFEQAYPTIEDVRIEVIETGSDLNEWNRKRYYGKEIGEFIDCQNRFCYNGGFSIGKILREMVDEKQIEYEKKNIICQGYEGSPKGKIRYRSCLHCFDVKVKIKYKEEPKGK